MAKRKKPRFFCYQYQQLLPDDAKYQFLGEGWYLIVHKEYSRETHSFERVYAETYKDLEPSLEAKDVIQIKLLSPRNNRAKFEDTVFYLHFDKNGIGEVLECLSTRRNIAKFIDENDNIYTKKITKRKINKNNRGYRYEECEPIRDGWSEIVSYADIDDPLGAERFEKTNKRILYFAHGKKDRSSP